jgi:hypothetical protein
MGFGVSLHRVRIWLRVSGAAARLVSTPSRPFRAERGSGSPCYRVPRTLSSSTPPVSRQALKFSLKSDASADSATPERFQRYHETPADPIGLLSCLREWQCIPAGCPTGMSGRRYEKPAAILVEMRYKSVRYTSEATLRGRSQM